MHDLPADVPSPIDLQAEADARAWAEQANALRPWRSTFFETMAEALDASRPLRVLELGSGPGFLAEVVLQRRPQVEMMLLDFSEPMHRMARERLQPFQGRVSHELRSFKSPDWMDGLGCFDAVLTHQAVHELRHKRYTQPLHQQVRGLLNDGGSYLMSDHWFGEGGMRKEGLYLTVDEQREALQGAGFEHVTPLLQQHGIVLFLAR
jgi:cyclopropane fatty-acyl-phospholipid synthase-like methyltransferase